MKEFKDKVAVITGAASGLGYSLAKRCAQEGMKVVLADIDEKALSSSEREIKATGASTLAVQTDVSKVDSVKALAQKTLDVFGTVHLLFNNAGILVRIPGGLVWKTTLNDWQWTINVNLWGVIHGVHVFYLLCLSRVPSVTLSTQLLLLG